MKPTTLEQALKLVPEYVLLRPGVDVWRDGDEKYWDEMGWAEPQPLTIIGKKVQDVGRRPIPAEVREAMAWWIIFTAELDRRTIPLYRIMSFYDELKSNLLRLEEQMNYCVEVEEFGGIEAMAEYLENPNPFESWLASQGGAG